MKQAFDEFLPALIAFVLIVSLAIIFIFADNQMKIDCVNHGGKWVTGFIGGNYSSFCVPQ